MKTKYTTKIMYSANGCFSNQYANSNVSPYGTKWRVRLRKEDVRSHIVSATLLVSNWDIDQNKVDSSNLFYQLYIY